MNRFILVALAGVISGALITTQFTEPLIAQETKRVKSTYENLDLFGDIFERIRSSYVEEIDEEKLIESAISGMLSSLDPHSSYMAPEDFSTMQVQTRGEFGGLGIEVTQENGFIKVVSPIDDTPAANAGIEAGDFITKVDGESTLGKTLDEAVDKMRGPVGSEIIITVVREGVGIFDISHMGQFFLKGEAAEARPEGFGAFHAEHQFFKGGRREVHQGPVDLEIRHHVRPAQLREDGAGTAQVQERTRR